jgi:2',3'-cyclic-nucleotide 2'-phosphodiesterase (5'-nucleotidase family)
MQQRRDAKHVLLLDTGDALIGGGILGDRTQGEAIVAGMNLMQYNAMALGPQELSLGPQIISKRIEEAEFPMLSANTVDGLSGELVAQPYSILEIGEHRLGILGLTRIPDKAMLGFRVLDPYQEAAKYTAEIAPLVNAVIVLTNMNYRAGLSLAAAVPGIDLLVAARPGQLPTKVATAQPTGTIVVTAEQPLARHSGRRVGILSVTISSAGTLQSPAWTSVFMTKDIADSPQMTELLDKYRK